MSLKVLLVCERDETLQEVPGLIEGQPSLSLIDSVSVDSAVAAIRNHQPDIVWIEMAPAPVHKLSFLSEMRAAFPRKRYWASFRELDPELVRTAFRLGASDVFDSRISSQELSTTVGRATRVANPIAPISPGQKKLRTVLLSDAHEEKNEAIRALIGSSDELELSDAVFPLDDALQQVLPLVPQLIWIELSPDPEKALSLVARLDECLPTSDVFVSYDVPDPELVRRSYRTGASDFLDSERWNTDLPAAIQSLHLKRNPQAGATIKKPDTRLRSILIIVLLSALFCLLYLLR